MSKRRQSRVYWAIKHPETNHQRPATYEQDLFMARGEAWAWFAAKPGTPLSVTVAELEAKGYRAVKVRIVEEE